MMATASIKSAQRAQKNPHTVNMGGVLFGHLLTRQQVFRNYGKYKARCTITHTYLYASIGAKAKKYIIVGTQFIHNEYKFRQNQREKQAKKG